MLALLLKENKIQRGSYTYMWLFLGSTKYFLDQTLFDKPKRDSALKPFSFSMPHGNLTSIQGTLTWSNFVQGSVEVVKDLNHD